jgi:hypothetical protein
MSAIGTQNNAAQNAQKKARRRRSRKAKTNASKSIGAGNTTSNAKTSRTNPQIVDLARYGVDPALNRQFERMFALYMSKAKMMGINPEMAFNYAASLLSPGQFESRYPDSFTDQTQLVRMPMEFSVPINLIAGDPDSGRFSFLVQPHLGSTSDPSMYKAAIVDTSVTPWADLDFTAPGAYLSLTQGRDPRLDTIFSVLTQPNLGCATLNATNAGTTFPFDTFVYVAPTYGITIQDGLGDDGDIMFAQGIYRVTFIGQDATGNEWNVLALGGAVISELATHATGNLTVLSFALTIGGNGMGLNITSNGIVWISAQLLLTQMFFTTNNDGSPVAIPLNGGIVNTYRPVALSVLATYTGSYLINGGNLVAGLIPGQSANQNYFTTNPAKSLGQLQNFENLAQVKGVLRTTKMANGAYIYYRPEKPTDTFLFTPLEASEHEYPTIVVSGTYVPGTNDISDGPQNVLKVVVTTVYEMITPSFLWEQDSLCGSQAIIDLVNAEFRDLPTSMENPAHLSFIRNALAKIRQAFGWSVRNAPKIARAIETAGEVGAMFL